MFRVASDACALYVDPHFTNAGATSPKTAQFNQNEMRRREDLTVDNSVVLCVCQCAVLVVAFPYCQCVCVRECRRMKQRTLAAVIFKIKTKKINKLV